MKISKTHLLISSLILAVLFFIFFNRAFEKEIDFSMQVKPILNKNCISCHGGVKENGGLSMMTREDLLKAGDSGNPGIVPGNPEASELYQRIVHSDPEERMPYEKPALTKGEIKILKNWIKQGATWGRHWAFKPVAKLEAPKVKSGDGEWKRSPIDAFILNELKANDLQANSIADKATLVRRLSLDLIGMPAPQNIREAYFQDDSEKAYENLVDQLLASPHFGERWASMWMDLARYADSKGPERDVKRDIWEYRDWLIRAFNADLPYDQFLTEQIAGDLLPNPTDAQYIATGFHRNTETNDEGGTNNDEFRSAAVVDRVNTTWEAIMGSTFACTQCHGHPYDPIKHEEYYEFMAYFDNTLDHDTFDDYPWLRTLDEEQKSTLGEVLQWLKGNDFAQEAKAAELFVKTWQPAYYSLRCDSLSDADIYDTKFLGMRNNGIARLAQVNLSGRNNLIYRYGNNRPGGKWTLHLDRPDGPIIAQVKTQKTQGWQIEEVQLKGELSGVHDLYFKFYDASLGESNSAPLRFDWFNFTTTFPGKGLDNYDDIKGKYWNLIRAKTKHTLIMVENPADMRRSTRVWDRGSWSTQKEEVQADIPDIFKFEGLKVPQNRLELAEWLASEKNPLTARTLVNRIWEQMMGRGIVETLEDLGTQGISPTHPELLEYLSWNFMRDYQWSMKRLIKEIALSATYRQSSIISVEAMEKDPLNHLYSRAERFRLSAEQVRDQALKVSGLLYDTLYGPPVMPYQPDGIWSVPYNPSRWEESEGKQIYRRAIYTFWKRSAPYPAFITFDAAPRTVCSARRIRTNTPLQALVTLNDSTFVEAAIHLAAKHIEVGDRNKRISAAYQAAIGKEINAEKLAALAELYEAMYQDYEADAKAAKDLINISKSSKPSSDLAAFTIVANAIMNLDEFITRS